MHQPGAHIIYRGDILKFSSLPEAVAHYADKTPDKTCLIEAETDRRLTYGEFWRHIRVFAGRLINTGLKKGDRVVVRVGALPETFVAQFGIYLAGGVYCPVEKHMKELKTLEMLDYYDSSFLISTEPVHFNGKYIELASALDNGTPLENFVFPGSADICAIVFTTGTTGKAKGVMLDYASSVFYSELHVKVLDFSNKDVYLWIQPLDKANGISMFGGAIISGATAVHYGELAFVRGFFEAVAAYGVNLIRIPVASATLLLKAMPEAFAQYSGQIRVIEFSTGALHEKHMHSLRELMPDTLLLLYYGSTETGNMATLDFREEFCKDGCIGKVLPGRKIRFLDENGSFMEKTSAETPGIFFCEGGRVMAGYWKDPELTAKTLVGGGVVMADLGYCEDDGYYWLTGRKDDVIATGGHRVAPYEIENAAMRIPGVRECVCAPVPDAILGSVPKLFVVMEDGAEFSAAAILKVLAAHLETFKLPRAIVEIESIPRIGDNQKIDRKKLIEYV